MRRLLFAALVIGAVGCGPADAARARRQLMQQLPDVMLWAWERPEDLSFLKPGEAGVAFLAATATWTENSFEWRPRLQPLVLPDGIEVEAVVRLESNPRRPPLYSSDQCTRLAEAIVALGLDLGVRRLQLDFDARLSEREGYRRLLEKTRERWPPTRTLTMTALVSWCLFDDWITDLPVDAALPMLFQMGPDGDAIKFRLRAGRFSPVPLARSAWGVATDELDLPAPNAVRLYVFHAKPWSWAAFEEFQQWRIGAD